MQLCFMGFPLFLRYNDVEIAEQGAALDGNSAALPEPWRISRYRTTTKSATTPSGTYRILLAYSLVESTGSASRRGSLTSPGGEAT